MKILVVNKFLYSKGGDAVSSISTGKLFASRGHHVAFWGMSHPLNPHYLLENDFISYVDFNDNNNSWAKSLKNIFNIFYSTEAKIKFLKTIESSFFPDIIHLNNFAHQISPSILSVAKVHKIPMVMTMHDYKLVCPSYTMILKGNDCNLCKDGKFFNCFLQRCVKNSSLKSAVCMIEMYLHHKVLKIYDFIDVFISPSMFMKRTIEGMGFTKKIYHLPHFLDFDAYEPSYTWEDRSIVYFGRLSYEKGILTLLEAMKNTNINLKIIGDGPLKKEIETKINSWGLKNVKLLGYKSGEDLKNEIRKSMFVVVPSEWGEVFGYAVLESFALGKPVIGSDQGAIPELIQENETGLIFKARDAGDLSEKINIMLNSPEKIILMGQKARKSARISFSAEKYYTGLMAIYQSVLNHAV